MCRRLEILTIAALLLIVGSRSALAGGVSIGEVDDFEDGTTESWQEGGASPNPPTNVATGGPMGVDDNYLQNVSVDDGDADDEAGERLVMSNTAQWTGNFNALGPEVSLSVDLNNEGASPLMIRFSISNGSTFWTTGDAAAFSLPAVPGWSSATFTLSTADMVQVLGTDPLATVLGNVTRATLMHSTFPAAGNSGAPPSKVSATLGVDNLRIESVPVELQSFSIE